MAIKLPVVTYRNVYYPVNVLNQYYSYEDSSEHFYTEIDSIFGKIGVSNIEWDEVDQFNSITLFYNLNNAPIQLIANEYRYYTYLQRYAYRGYYSNTDRLNFYWLSSSYAYDEDSGYSYQWYQHRSDAIDIVWQQTFASGYLLTREVPQYFRYGYKTKADVVPAYYAYTAAYYKYTAPVYRVIPAYYAYTKAIYQYTAPRYYQPIHYKYQIA